MCLNVCFWIKPRCIPLLSYLPCSPFLAEQEEVSLNCLGKTVILLPQPSGVLGLQVLENFSAPSRKPLL